MKNQISNFTQVWQGESKNLLDYCCDLCLLLIKKKTNGQIARQKEIG